MENRWNIKNYWYGPPGIFGAGYGQSQAGSGVALAHTLGQDRVQLYADYDRPVNQKRDKGLKS